MPRVPNNYPATYTQQEQELMRQIAARRKAYMQKYGSSEDEYVNADNVPTHHDSNFTYDKVGPDNGDGRDDLNLVKRLFS
jgi:hypothetical protein